jgi:hypothetical protein
MFVDLDCEYEENKNLCRSEFTKKIDSFPVLRYYTLGYKDIDNYIEYSLNSEFSDYQAEIDEDLADDESIVLHSKTDIPRKMEQVFKENRMFAILYYVGTVPEAFKVVKNMRIFRKAKVQFGLIEHNYRDDSTAT